jgi:hypothetical protein
VAPAVPLAVQRATASLAQVTEGRKAITEGGVYVNFSCLWFICAAYEIASADTASADTLAACTYQGRLMVAGALNAREGETRGEKSGPGLEDSRISSPYRMTDNRVVSSEQNRKDGWPMHRPLGWAGGGCERK